MTEDKDSPDYWLKQIKAEGLDTVERTLPNTQGKKREALEQAIREHERAESKKKWVTDNAFRTVTIVVLIAIPLFVAFCSDKS